jgi:Fur family peroxide stress response transcriptional regulator
LIDATGAISFAGMTIPRTDSARVLRDALLASGHRFTPQRAEVFSVLAGSTSHPTADEIFTAVRATIPDISLATVYKALETLVGCGLAQKLCGGDGPARYDHRTDAHAHARCVSCGALIDVEGENPLLRSEPRADGFLVLEYRLELIGYCRSCRN